MADVPILDEPRLRAPLVDPKTGHATTDFAIFLSQLYKRVGVATGDLPADLVKELALKDGAVTNPKVAAGAVTNPKVAADAIDTLNVIDNAITIPGAALSAAALDFNSTIYTVVQSITITPSGNNAVFIYFNGAYSLDNTTGLSKVQVYFRITRGATILHPEWPLMFANASGTFNDAEALSYVDLTPPNTASTYQLELRITPLASVSADASHRTALVLEARK